MSGDGPQNQKPKFMKPFTNNVNSLDRELWMYTVTHRKSTTFFSHGALFFKICFIFLKFMLKHIHNERFRLTTFFKKFFIIYFCRINFKKHIMIRPLNILLAENDIDLATITRDYLVNNGYVVTLCENKEDAWLAFNREQFDFLIIDTALSRNEGIDLLADVRKIDILIPIIILGANVTQDDIHLGLKLEADDFLTRPFSLEELGLRIEIIMKRVNIGIRTQHLYKIGKYTLDTLHHVLVFNGKEKKLTAKELDLLFLFCQYKNRVVERHLALKKVWNQENYFSARNMDVYIKRLRNMLRDDPDVHLDNVHGVGYKLTIYGL